ncbi:hypothetical protein BD413DRAFT_516543 [Trametes elegans]|nr:hypothetical protein BD413DRAFT_516543 [Trametes elegans]
MTAQSLARHIQNIHLKMQYTCSKCLASGRPEAYVRDHGPARDCKRVAKVQGNATSLVDAGVDSVRPQPQHPRRALTDGAPYPSSSGAPSPTNIDGQLPGQETTPQMRNPAFGAVDMGACPVRIRRRQERRARTWAPYSSSGISLPTSIDVARFAPETTPAHQSSSHPASAPFAVPDATRYNLDWLAMSYADYHAQAPSSTQDALPHQIPPQTDPVYYSVPQFADAGPSSAVAMPPAVAPGVMNTTLYNPSLYPQIGCDAPYSAAQDTVPHQIPAQPDLAPLVPSGIPQFPDTVPSSAVAMPPYATPDIVDTSYAPSLDAQSGYGATYASGAVDATPYLPSAHPQVEFDALYAQVYPPFDPGYDGGQDDPDLLARYWSQ